MARTTLSSLPVETFLDCLLPILPNRDLVHLSAANREFYQLASDDTLWKRKLQEDFNFPVAETARNTGWKLLYRRLTRPGVYVWGARANGRLGIPQRELPQTQVQGGIPFPAQLRLPGVRVVDLVAGGMSFHALDSKGDVYVWGTLNAENFALQSEGFAQPGKPAQTPHRLQLDARIRSISCARLFSAALAADGAVWTLTAWGRPFRLLSPQLDASTPYTTAAQVECGWYFVSVLTQTGDVLAYWPSVGAMQIALSEKNNELNADRANWARVREEEPGVIPCCPFDFQWEPVRLPAIPHDLPRLEGAGREKGRDDAVPKLVRIAGMDNAVVGLTDQGHVLRCVGLTGPGEVANARWEYLSYFSESDKVCEDAAFTSGDAPLPKPSAMHITHISASFLTFFAYSTGPSSLVLQGSDAPSTPHEPLRPLIIPALQNTGVISVVVGDYHYGALTSSGALLTWGAFSSGALGLGEPVDIPAGVPGGFASEDVRRAMRGAPVMRAQPPDVRVPTEVRFDRGLDRAAGTSAERRERRKLCFAVAAAGWHMGALVVDLDADGDAEDEEGEKAMPGAYPSEDGAGTPLPPTTGHGHQVPLLGHRGGMLPFRVGFAGRGMHTAGRGRGQGDGL